MKSALNLPMSVKLILALFLLVCVWDFTQRVWVSADANARDDVSFAAEDYVNSNIEMADTVKNWLAEREAMRQAAAEPEQEQETKEPAIPLIEGGMNLGNVRVRVRAIYTAPSSQTSLALLDIQSIEQRSVEIIEAHEGYSVESYALETIDVNSVVFRSAEGEALTIPVFDY